MLDELNKTPYSKRMSKFRLVLQVTLGIILAFGLIISPLQNPTVVFSARSKEDIVPPAEANPEGGVEQPAVVEPVEEPAVVAPVDVLADVSEDNQPAIVSSPESGLSEEIPAAEPLSVDTATLPESQTQEVVEAPTTESVIEETIVPVNPDVQPTVAETQSIETPLPTDDVLQAVQPTLQEMTPVANQTETPGENEEQAAITSSWTGGQVEVHFDPSISTQDQIARLTNLGLEIISSIPELGVFVVSVATGLEQESISALSVMDGIKYAEPVYVASALDVVPNDPGYVNQGDMAVINAPGGWEYFTGSSNIIIAIIDSGVDMNHPDLVGKVLPGWDFVNNDNNAQDDYGHGTHVAGIAAATGNNSTGIAGMDWSAKILPIKVLDNTGNGTAANVALGIIYAVNHGANIINLSLGITNNSTLIADAIEYAYQHGVTVVASTGNTNEAVTYPAAYPHVIAVGAVDNSENRWVFSNHGPEIDLVAPGVNIYSTDISGYSTRTGTSMAAAHVSGLAALLMGMTSLTPDQVTTTIEETSQDLGTAGWDTFFGYGLIQVKDAILRLFNALFPVVREASHHEAPTIIPWPTITPTPTPTPTLVS